MPDLPNHIAIIMDGNGRWAKSRMMPRTFGHKKGVDTTRDIVEYAAKIGLKYLTLYAFSTENWSRPDDEINDLMGLLRQFLKSEAEKLIANNIVLNVIGFRDRLSQDIIDMIDDVTEKSSQKTGMHLNIALDYGGRQDIVSAVNQLIAKGVKQVDIDDINDNLLTAGIPDPDLIIRTSGEQRISNFLLWQCAYTEFIFSDVLWPDFKSSDLDDALADFQGRDRRYGCIESA